jgi:hypothetical protein
MEDSICLGYTFLQMKRERKSSMKTLVAIIALAAIACSEPDPPVQSSMYGPCLSDENCRDENKCVATVPGGNGFCTESCSISAHVVVSLGQCISTKVPGDIKMERQCSGGCCKVSELGGIHIETEGTKSTMSNYSHGGYCAVDFDFQPVSGLLSPCSADSDCSPANSNDSFCMEFGNLGSPICTAECSVIGVSNAAGYCFSDVGSNRDIKIEGLEDESQCCYSVDNSKTDGYIYPAPAALSSGIYIDDVDCSLGIEWNLTSECDE